MEVGGSAKSDGVIDYCRTRTILILKPGADTQVQSSDFNTAIIVVL
jgi:hypothetical protein